LRELKQLAQINKLAELKPFKSFGFDKSIYFYTRIYVSRGNKLLSKIPVEIKNVSEGDIDKEILRAAIIAELDAVNLYEQMANLTKDENIKAVLMDIAKEEKTHIGEFQALLLQFDPQHKQELEAGAKEAEEVLSK
jgi:rubrerythrin